MAAINLHILEGEPVFLKGRVKEINFDCTLVLLPSICTYSKASSPYKVSQNLDRGVKSHQFVHVLEPIVRSI